MRIDVAISYQGISHPINQTSPIFSTDQHNWVISNLAGLYHAEHFKKLIHRTHATWQTNKSLRVLQKHGLASKEVPEIDAQVDVLIKPLFKGQFNTYTNGEPTGFIRTAVGSFHNAWAAAGNHGIVVLNELRSQFNALGILGRIFFSTRRTIDSYGLRQSAQCIKPSDEFSLNTQNPPWIRMFPGMIRARF